MPTLSVFSLVSGSLVGASVICYGVALFLPAYHEGGGSLVGDLNLLGLECLFIPLMLPILIVFPPWWANPIYFFGLFALLQRRYAVSAVAGASAALLAAGFAAVVSYPLNNDRLRLGFWFWCAAIVLLFVVGGVGHWWKRR